MIAEVKDYKGKSSNNRAITSKEIDEIKNNISSIEDKRIQNELFNDLYEIAEYCQKLSDKPIKNYEKTCSILLEQVSMLRKNIDEVLKKEREERENNRSCYKIMTEVNERIEETKEEYALQKKIGAR